MMDRAPIRRQRSPWEEIPGDLTAGMLEDLGAERVTVYERRVGDGILRAIAALEPGGWHLSVSHRARSERAAKRYPTWDELADARYTLAPADVDMVMHLPPSSEYVALDDTTFHLHEYRGGR